MKFTNKHNLPRPLYDALVHDSYYHEGSISATGLIKSPREYQLCKRHDDEVVKDATDNIWSLMGSIGHNIIERENVGEGLKEERLYMDIKGWKLAGKPDLWMAPDSLHDYKFTSVWVYIMDRAKIEWEQQLNIYAYMMTDAGFPVKNLYVNAIFRDWQKSKAKREKNYPQVGYKRYKMKLWSNTEQRDYINERVELHQSLELVDDDLLPECTPEQRWESETVYAVMKNGNKRSTKNCKNIEMAEKYIAAHKDGSKMYVDTRVGESRKCIDYCDAAPFCNQWRRICDE
jgi:hypothetical protein